MNVTGTTELARMKMLQRQAVEVRTGLDRAAYEATTSLKADQHKATGGNLARLFAIERMLERNAVHRETIALTEMRLDVVQEGLGRALAWVERVGLPMVAATSLGDGAAARLHAEVARQGFRDTVGMLNTQVSGQSLFAGIRTDGPALAPADAILDDLAALIAGTADAGTAAALIDGYLARTPPGGFYAGGYLGADKDLAPADVGGGTRVAASVRADADEIVAVLKAQAMAALVARGDFVAPEGERMALLADAGHRLIAAKEGMLALRGRVGIAQEAVETAKAQRNGERETYELARARIVGADAFDAASVFQALQAQLESVFTVTARLGSLRFVNFIR